jgi:AcrR family transcriptional regulator
VPAPKGRARRGAEITRERILEAAERLFAVKGYDGTSIRDVAAAAGVQIANISYHFGLKESLFERVIERRAAFMCERRMSALERYRAKAGAKPIPVENLIEGYVWPFIERSSRGGEAWTAYTQLIARLVNTPRWGPMISRYYDEVARAYVAELKRTLPDARPASIYNGLNFMVGTMLVVCADTGRMERVSDGTFDSRKIELVFEDMLPFLRGGFMSIAGRRKS